MRAANPTKNAPAASATNAGILSHVIRNDDEGDAEETDEQESGGIRGGQSSESLT